MSTNESIWQDLAWLVDYQRAGDYYTHKPLAVQEASILSREFSPKSVLDVGAGTGTLLLALKELAIECQGIDIAPHKMAPSISQASVEDIPFADRRFDMVTAFGVLDYVGSLTKALSEIRRVLNLGGVLVAAVALTKDHRRNVLSVEEWRSLIDKSGLSWISDAKVEDELLYAMLSASRTFQGRIAKLIGGPVVDRELHRRFSILFARNLPHDIY